MPPALAPYGSWRSPIAAELLAAAATRFGALQTAGDALAWLEGRPLENGRNVVVCHSANGSVRDITPPGVNTRTTVHEYGGGDYRLTADSLFYSNFADQRIYRLALHDPLAAPQPITPAPVTDWGLRYADLQLTPDGQWLVCVRQFHPNSSAAEAINEIVILPADGGKAPRVLASGHDFFSDPLLSPDGRRLAWLCWDHPNMPWDGSELWLADFDAQSGLTHARRVAGGAEESISLPRWSPAGELHFVSDRSGWWNLYRERNGAVETITALEAEFALPQWVFGYSRYCFLPDGRIAAIYSQNGLDHLALIASDGSLRTLPTGLTAMAYPVYYQNRLWLVGGNATLAVGIVAVRLEDGAFEVIRPGMEMALDPGYLPLAQPVAFPSENGLQAHAFYYPPTNRDFSAPAGELPPLLVHSHGGPTGAARPTFSLETAYWCSRGFAILDVNYGGSSGYGRAYRQRLDGNWGVVDVQDCIAAARWLIAQGKADPRRVAVRGGSAGGYTTLCALTMHNFFTAGASYFGIADLEPLAQDTHKFEARYLDRLVGPYPAAQALYRQRSPIHFSDRIACPMILFQGLEDKVVPPAQSEMMAQALQANNLPYAYLTFAGEQHGFRQAANIRRAAEAELYFYSKVFAFELADDIEPVTIHNLK